MVLFFLNPTSKCLRCFVFLGIDLIFLKWLNFSFLSQNHDNSQCFFFLWFFEKIIALFNKKKKKRKRWLTCKFLGGSPVQTPCCSLLLWPYDNDDFIYDGGYNDDDGSCLIIMIIITIFLPFHCYYSPSRASQFQLSTRTHPPCSRWSFPCL